MRDSKRQAQLSSNFFVWNRTAGGNMEGQFGINVIQQNGSLMDFQKQPPYSIFDAARNGTQNNNKGVATSRPGVRRIQQLTGETNDQKHHTLNPSSLEIAGTQFMNTQKQADPFQYQGIVSQETEFRQVDLLNTKVFNGQNLDNMKLNDLVIPQDGGQRGQTYRQNENHRVVLAQGIEKKPSSTTQFGWTRNQGINASDSLAKRSESQQAPLMMNTGIQGLGYPSQYGFLAGKFMSNYQRLQSEKARNFLENQSKQISRGEQQLQLGGKQLNINPYLNNSSKSPPTAMNVPQGTVGRLPLSGEIQKGISLAITRERDRNGNILTRSRDSNIIDVNSSLGDGIIISKINVVHQGMKWNKNQAETSLTTRKIGGINLVKGESSILTDIKGVKKTSAGVQNKYYQTLSSSEGGISQIGGNPHGLNIKHQTSQESHLKPASPTPNLDLESIINNSDAYFKQQRSQANTKQKPRQLPNLNRLDLSNLSSSPYSIQLQKQILHAQVLSNSSAAGIAQGNLKYHMIRKLLEEANPTELAQIVQLQQIQQALMLQQHLTPQLYTKQSFSPNHKTLQNQKSPKKEQELIRKADNIQSSKDIRNQGSMLQGESLLIENSTNPQPHSQLTNQMSHGKSSLSKNKLQGQRQFSIESFPSNSRLPNQGLQISIKKDQSNLSNLQDATTPYIGRKLKEQQQTPQALKHQKFQVLISSNTREKSKEMIVGVSINKENSKEGRSFSNPKQRENHPNKPLKQKFNDDNHNQPIAIINQSQIQRNSLERRDYQRIQQQQNWEDSLCVQIRQLPIYSKNGTAIPLQSFVNSDFVGTKTANAKQIIPDHKAKTFYNNTQVPTKMKHLDVKNTTAISNLQNPSQTTNKFVVAAQQMQYQSNPATKIGAFMTQNKDQYTASSRTRRKQMSMTQKEQLQMNQKVMLNQDVSSKTLGPFEEEREKSFHMLNSKSREELTSNNAETPINHTIKVPHIEFQKDLQQKTNKKINYSPIKPATDSSPTRLHYEKRKISENKALPPQLKELLHQSSVNNQVLAHNQSNSLQQKRNSYFPLQPPKGLYGDGLASNFVNIATSISQNSLVQTGQDAIPIMQGIINNYSSEHNQSILINHASTVLQSKNTKSPDVGSIINQPLDRQQTSDRRNSIVVLNIMSKRQSNDGLKLPSPERNREADSSPSMQLEQQESKDEDYQAMVLPPGYPEDYDQRMQLPTIQDQSQDDKEAKTSIEINAQSITRVVNSLEVTLAEVKNSSNNFQHIRIEPGTIILPSLKNKKYPVSFQQQLHQISSTQQETQIKIIKKREQSREAIKKDQEEQELRESKYNALLNCFERLSKNMKDRNNPFNLKQLSSLMTGQLNPYDASKLMMSSENFQTSIFASQFTEEEAMNYQVMEEATEKMNRNGISNNDNRFFKALQKQQMNNGRQFQQETQLMMKTKQQMKQLNMSEADKIRNKFKGMRTCPFQVVKNGLSLMQQQIQLSKILEVPELEIIEQVPFIKQTCLVEYVKEQWENIFKGPSVMKDYQYFCLYYPSLVTYKLIIFGTESPISKCCNKLIIFHFSQISAGISQDNERLLIKENFPQSKAILRVFCCDSVCSNTPLFEKIITSKSFVDSILNTPNGSPVPMYVASTVPNQNPTFSDYRPQGNLNYPRTNRSRQTHIKHQNYHNQQQFYNTSRDIMMQSDYGGNNASMYERINGAQFQNSESYEDEDYHLESIQYLKGTQAFDQGQIYSDPRTIIFENSLNSAKNNKMAKISKKKASLESSLAQSKEGSIEGQHINDISINKYLSRIESDPKPV